MYRKTTLALCAIFVATAGVANAQTVKTTRIATGLSLPTDIQSHESDPNRLFICEQRGTIRIIENGVLLATPFLNIDPLVINSLDERGLLGLAFHPDYDTNGYFFVYYTAPGGQGVSTVARYTVTANPNVADPASALILLTLTQPSFNHNAGQLAFGPDGYLYVGFGDGGSGNDPGNRAQNTGIWFGKILRIDVDGDDFPTDATRNYAIPPTNPFVGAGNPLDEIWAIGVRNPWRYSFDRHTGDLYIADVGQGQREEVTFQPASSVGGENYGWRCMEGTRCTGLSGCTCNAPTLTLPIHEYTHSQGCSITGGYVYRGSDIPQLCGTYFFADYCSNTIWSFRYVDGAVTEFTNRTAEMAPGGGQSIGSISTFGLDTQGEMYIADRSGGEIFKILNGGPGPFDEGDFDQDGDVDLGDFAQFSLCFGGANLPPAGSCVPGVNADFDCDGDVDLSDFATFSLNFTG